MRVRLPYFDRELFKELVRRRLLVGLPIVFVVALAITTFTQPAGQSSPLASDAQHHGHETVLQSASSVPENATDLDGTGSGNVPTNTTSTDSTSAGAPNTGTMSGSASGGTGDILVTNPTPPAPTTIPAPSDGCVPCPSDTAYGIAPCTTYAYCPAPPTPPSPCGSCGSPRTVRTDGFMCPMYMCTQ